MIEIYVKPCESGLRDLFITSSCMSPEKISNGVDYCISAIFELYFLLYLVTFLSWDEFGVGSLLTSVVQKVIHVLVTA